MPAPGFARNVSRDPAAVRSNDAGTWVRKERFTGSCRRSFYVGDDVQEEDIHAKFDQGLLKIAVPKKQPQPKLDEARTIAIEG